MNRFPPALPANTRPFRFCNYCPLVQEDARERFHCARHGALKTKIKFFGTAAGDFHKVPVRHVACKEIPRNAEEVLDGA